MKSGINKNNVWPMAIVIVALLIASSIAYSASIGYTVRFEMDNNTLEAIKSINWTAINTVRP